MDFRQDDFEMDFGVIFVLAKIDSKMRSMAHHRH